MIFFETECDNFYNLSNLIGQYLEECNLKIEEIRTPEDVLNFMNANIEYGWIDASENVHQKEMKNFRAKYHIAPLEQCLQYGGGKPLGYYF